MQVKGYGPLTLIEVGGFSSVYKAQNTSLKKSFAIKVLRPTSNSSDSHVTAYREVQALSVASHPNIVKLHEVVQSSGSLCLVMEYCPFNLGQLCHHVVLPESLAKGFMLQLLRGLAHLHELGIVHRDIKPQNLLLSASGGLKICDMGLCRLSPDLVPGRSPPPDEVRVWTLHVGTHFYRAPELLLGDRGYTKAIDIWAAGCVLAELLCGEPLFPGLGDFELLSMISGLLGSPSEQTWPGVSQLPDFGKILFKEKPRVDMHATFPSWGAEATDLFEKMIVYDPSARISARAALHHAWFAVEPAPIMAPYDGKAFDLFESVTL
jgi:serine/threonine protein kinase